MAFCHDGGGVGLSHDEFLGEGGTAKGVYLDDVETGDRRGGNGLGRV